MSIQEQSIKKQSFQKQSIQKQPSQSASSLFRPEALSHQQQRLFGDISLAQPVSLYLIALSLAGIFFLLMTFLLSAEHHRKERIRGYLAPSKGMLHVFAKRDGVVKEVFVKEGDLVVEGDTLATMVNPQHRGSIHLEDVLVAQLEDRIGSLQKSVADHQDLLAHEVTSSRILQAELENKLKHTLEQIELSDRELKLHEQRVQGRRRLAIAGHIPQVELNLTEERFLEHRQRKMQLHEKVLALQQEIRVALDQTTELPLRHALIERQLLRTRSELQQQLEQTRSSFRSEVKASQSGRVTSVLAHSGRNVTSSEPLLSIVPSGADLIADLYLPSRSAGLVRVGNQTRLRFDAFPYQKFGLIEAEVLQVDQSLLLPERYQHAQASEPVYRIRAHLFDQAIKLEGESYPLMAGMQVEADVLLEKRRLLDWVLAPLIGLRSRLR